MKGSIKLVKFYTVEKENNSELCLNVVIERDKDGNLRLPSTRISNSPLSDAETLSSKYGGASKPRVLDISEGEEVKISYFDTTCEVRGWVDPESLFSVNSLPRSLPAEDKKIIRDAVDRLSIELQYAETVITLLPRTFTLPAIRSLYEETWGGDSIDIRNFRRKFRGEDGTSAPLIEETDMVIHKGIRGRPPTLYTVSTAWKNSSPRGAAYYPTARSN